MPWPQDNVSTGAYSSMSRSSGVGTTKLVFNEPHALADDYQSLGGSSTSNESPVSLSLNGFSSSSSSSGNSAGRLMSGLNPGAAWTGQGDVMHRETGYAVQQRQQQRQLQQRQQRQLQQLQLRKQQQTQQSQPPQEQQTQHPLPTQPPIQAKSPPVPQILESPSLVTDSTEEMPPGITAPSVILPKRPRGRPRKTPYPSTEAEVKGAKGRSKTGCLTCRRRKKKCDENKPQCLNCQKSAVVCEGYLERIVWKSGREKAEEERVARMNVEPKALPILIHGIENEVDEFFYLFFVQNLGELLCTSQGEDNPYRRILLPMSFQHKGLMHSLLCLAGTHLANRDPDKYEDRRSHHYLAAIHELRTDKKLSDQANQRSTQDVDDSTVAQTLMLCLDSICHGERQGQYRAHLNVARYHAVHHNSKDEVFRQFIFEVFHYFDVASSLTALDRQPLMIMDDFVLPGFIVQAGAGTLLGVFDHLFGYISKITRIRHKLRARMQENVKPVLDYPVLNDAISLDTEIRTWISPQPEDTHKYIASQLYRQCTWIYLYRTIQPSRPTERITEAVEEGLSFLRQLPPDTATQSILLMPLFLLGCAAFLPHQRPDIRRAFGVLKRYSGRGNVDTAREVVERVWAHMDSESDSSWDWEAIVHELGYDFCVA